MLGSPQGYAAVDDYSLWDMDEEEHLTTRQDFRNTDLTTNPHRLIYAGPGNVRVKMT